MFLKIFLSAILLYVVLAGATYYDYKRPVELFGYFLPRSFGIWQWLIIGPIVMTIIGLVFGLIGIALLSPFVLYYFGLKWMALIILAVFGFLTRYASLFKIDGVSAKFGFPWDIPIGLFVFWIFGLFYSLIGALLLSPVLSLIYF